jgi:hypothetical protein
MKDMAWNVRFERLQTFLLSLECLSRAGQGEAIINEVIETGGTYVQPKTDGWSSHMFEIHLHGVVAFGSSEFEAFCNWKKNATRAQAAVDTEAA